MLHAIAFTLVAGAATPEQQLQRATRLAEAIASQRYTSARVYVGSLPPNVHITAPLPNLPLLGSLEQSAMSVQAEPGNSVAVAGHGTTTMFSAQSGSQHIMYYEAPSKEYALDGYFKELNARGWRSFDLATLFAEETPSGGFAIPQIAPPAAPRYFCNASGIVSIMRSAAMPEIVAVAVATGREEAAFCMFAQGASTMLPHRRREAPRLPTLRAPANVTMEPPNGVDCSPESDSAATLQTKLPADAVGAQFSDQLSAAGWKPDAAAKSATAYMQTFHRTRRLHFRYERDTRARKFESALHRPFAVSAPRR